VNNTIKGPRPGDLVRWSAEVEHDMQTVRTSNGEFRSNVFLSEPNITLTLYGINREEVYRVLGVINTIRGPGYDTYTPAPPEPKPPKVKPKPPEPPRPFNRFEGLDIE
jgi:hypothetical protein